MPLPLRQPNQTKTANVHNVSVHVLEERVDRLLIAGRLRELRIEQRDFRGGCTFGIPELLQMLVSTK